MKTCTHLFIDISNSWAKIAEGTLRRLGKVSRVLTSTLDSKFLSSLKKKYPNTTLIVSSVVPARSEIIRRSWNPQRLHILSHRSPLGIGIRYPQPATIGADRLADAIAAAHLYPCPAIVIDFGTAVTFDIISSDKYYLGGVIAPGLNAMLDYLHDRTALLPKIELREPLRAVGKSTTEAMRVGAVIGYRGLVKEILKQVSAELHSKKTTVIATGGYAKLIAHSLPEIQHLHPTLTLEGLRILANNLRS